MHESMVRRGAAPRQYVTLIDSIAALYAGKRDALQTQVRFLQGGLTKLEETSATVGELSAQAMEQEQVLKAKQIEAKEKMVPRPTPPPLTPLPPSQRRPQPCGPA